MTGDRDEMARFYADLESYTMPFGKYAGCPIDELPHEYLVWFQTRGGFPSGRLGELMAIVNTIKSEGDDSILQPVRQSRMRRQRKN